MARDHEMVSSNAPIPVRIFVLYHIDIISEDPYQSTMKGIGFKPEKAVNNFAHT